MKRWIKHAIFGMTLAGCVQQDATQTEPTIETAEASTCPGPGNFPNPIPPVTVPFWNGTVKLPSSSTQHLFTAVNPDAKGWSVVGLIDLKDGSMPWAASFVSANIGKVHAAAVDQPWIDILRPPPPPPPIGNRYFTAFVAETSLIAVGAQDMGAANVSPAILPQN